MATLANALLTATVCCGFAYGLWQRRCRQREAYRTTDARQRTRDLQAEVDTLTEQVQASQRDSLTDLLTRHHWESEAAALLAAGQAQAMIWIDLDRFKEINSTLGHLAGNVVLAEIGRRLRAREDSGLPGRFGGDEFVLVLPYRPTGAHLNQLAGQLSKPIIVTTPLDQTPSAVVLTASLGVAVWTSAAPHEVPILMELSDRAMRAAKRTGDCAFTVHKEHPEQIARRAFW